MSAIKPLLSTSPSAQLAAQYGLQLTAPCENNRNCQGSAESCRFWPKPGMEVTNCLSKASEEMTVRLKSAVEMSVVPPLKICTRQRGGRANGLIFFSSTSCNWESLQNERATLTTTTTTKNLK